MTAGALGFPIWGLLLPFRSSTGMQWSAEAMRADFPALVAWIFFGVVLGSLLQALTQLSDRVLGPETICSTVFVFLLLDRQYTRRLMLNPRLASQEILRARQSGTPAPALWMFAIGLGMLLPILLS